jgi:hypothetical protein
VPLARANPVFIEIVSRPLCCIGPSVSQWLQLLLELIRAISESLLGCDAYGWETTDASMVKLQSWTWWPRGDRAGVKRIPTLLMKSLRPKSRSLSAFKGVCVIRRQYLRPNIWKQQLLYPLDWSYFSDLYTTWICCCFLQQGGLLPQLSWWGYQQHPFRLIVCSRLWHNCIWLLCCSFIYLNG